MKQKRLMLLGGLRYLIPVIKLAHKHNIYVITVDYIPENIAHKYSDEYHNLSILDKETVLSLARRLGIDGIMSFAVDPGVVTAAYVAEEMGLPFQCSYESACILQDKSRFRAFLKEHNFNVPNAKGYNNKEEALGDIAYFNWPVIVKPTDSAGSKGVSRVDSSKHLSEAIDFALSCSHSGNFIIEDFLEKEGCSSDSDSFVVDGELVFCSFSDQIFDSKADNPYTPSAYLWPASMKADAQNELKIELQRLTTLLGIKTGIFNIETRLCTNGKAYIMEMSPRGGGNRLAEMLRYATGTDIIEAEVCSSVGEPIKEITEPVYNDFIHESILHADEAGHFSTLSIAPELKDLVLEEDIWVQKGEKVEAFSGANMAIGTLVLRLDKMLDNLDSKIKVLVQ